jgi:hypothetical protein
MLARLPDRGRCSEEDVMTKAHDSTAIRPEHRRNDVHALDDASGIGGRAEAGLLFAVSAMDRDLTALSRCATTAEGAAAAAAALESWAELVDELALGPAPDVRRCPECNHLGMSAATLCGFCWTRLTPIVVPAAVRG